MSNIRDTQGGAQSTQNSSPTASAPTNQATKSKRQTILDSMIDPGVGAKERGVVGFDDDEEMVWYDKKEVTWVPAVYHNDIRTKLIEGASSKEDDFYDEEPPRGLANDDITAFHPEQRYWKTARNDWGTIKDNVLNRLHRNDYSRPDYKLESMYDEGRIVLDSDNHPIKNYWDLPMTLSSATDGLRMEVWWRLDSRINARDFWARMPKDILLKNGQTKPLHKLAAIGNRRERFRQQVGLFSWLARTGTEARKQAILNNLPENAAGSTTGAVGLSQEPTNQKQVGSRCSTPKENRHQTEHLHLDTTLQHSSVKRSANDAFQSEEEEVLNPEKTRNPVRPTKRGKSQHGTDDRAHQFASKNQASSVTQPLQYPIDLRYEGPGYDGPEIFYHFQNPVGNEQAPNPTEPIQPRLEPRKFWSGPGDTEDGGTRGQIGVPELHCEYTELIARHSDERSRQPYDKINMSQSAYTDLNVGKSYANAVAGGSPYGAPQSPDLVDDYDCEDGPDMLRNLVGRSWGPGQIRNFNRNGTFVEGGSPMIGVNGRKTQKRDEHCPHEFLNNTQGLPNPEQPKSKEQSRKRGWDVAAESEETRINSVSKRHLPSSKRLPTESAIKAQTAKPGQKLAKGAQKSRRSPKISLSAGQASLGRTIDLSQPFSEKPFAQTGVPDDNETAVQHGDGQQHLTENRIVQKVGDDGVSIRQMQRYGYLETDESEIAENETQLAKNQESDSSETDVPDDRSNSVHPVGDDKQRSGKDPEVSSTNDEVDFWDTAPQTPDDEASVTAALQYTQVDFCDYIAWIQPPETDSRQSFASQYNFLQASFTAAWNDSWKADLEGEAPELQHVGPWKGGFRKWSADNLAWSSYKGEIPEGLFTR